MGWRRMSAEDIGGGSCIKQQNSVSASLVVSCLCKKMCKGDVSWVFILFIFY